MIRAVSFDAAGTLITLTHSVGWHYREVAARHGLEAAEPALDRAFRAAWRRREPAAGNAEAHREWWRALVEEVFLEVTGAGVSAAFFAELFAHFAEPGVWELADGAGEVLEELQTSYRLIVLSNFDARLRTILEHLGIAARFEAILISSDIGWAKPDPRAFATVAERLALPPGALLHVGDDPRLDGDGARAAGCAAFVLDPPRRTLADLPAWLARAQRDS